MARYLIGNVKGPAGEDGFSPVARVEQTSTGATITVTDANGTTTANIRNGIDGDGSPIDLSEYATKVEVAALAADIEAQDYATETYVDDAVAGVTIPVTSVNGMVGNVTIDVPTKTSDLTNDSDFVNQTALAAKQDVLTAGTGISIENNVISATSSGGITTETDPVFSASPAATITSEDIADWDAKSEFSGSYNDLTNKPDLSVYATQTALTNGLADKQDTLTAGTNISIDNNVISATDTTYTAGTGIDITNGVISAIGGGGSSNLVVYEMTSTSPSDNAQLLAMGQNFQMPDFIKYNDILWALVANAQSGTRVYYHSVLNNALTSSHVVNHPYNLLEITFNNQSRESINRITTYDDLQLESSAVSLGAPANFVTGSGRVTLFDAMKYLKDTVIPSIDGGSAADELPTIASGDAGKVLTVNSGETGVEWTTPASGGATYTAGNGIEIDANNEISLLSNKTSLLPILYSILTRNTGMARQDGFLQQLWQNKLMRSNIQAHIDNLHTFGMTYFSDGLNQNTIQSLATEFYETMPSLILFRYNATEFTDQYTFGLAQTSLAPENSNWGTMFANKPVFAMYIPEASTPWIFITYPEKMFQNMYFNSQQGLSSHSIAAAIDELAAGKQDALPALTDNAGKVLTVNSGATGLEWTTPASGGSSYGDADVGNYLYNNFGLGTNIEDFNYVWGGDNLTSPVTLTDTQFDLNAQYRVEWNDSGEPMGSVNDNLNIDTNTMTANIEAAGLFKLSVPVYYNENDEYVQNGDATITLLENWISSYGIGIYTISYMTGYLSNQFIKIDNNTIQVDDMGQLWVPSSGGSTLPADPAADGTYFLTTTVSSGTATQSWVTIPTANGNNF